MICTRCENSGFLNVEQLPYDILECDPSNFHETARAWIAANAEHDVQVCDCCGDGEGWYGTPGEHYGPNDQPGSRGPYASNGGLCRCH